MIKKIIKKLFITTITLSVRFYNSRLKWHLNKIVVEEQNKSIFLKATCGKGITIDGTIVVTSPEMLILGNNVHIGKNGYFSTRGGLSIGDNTQISRNVTIYTNNHRYEGETVPFDSKFVDRPVFIGKDVWIGMNVSITSGVTIGNGAIIGMGAVISKDVPELAVVGNEAYRVLKFRDQKRYLSLTKQRRFGGRDGMPLKNEPQLFAQNGLEIGKKLFFIIGSDRSACASVAATLSEHPEITCRHEPNGQLIRLSTELIHKVKDGQQIKKELKRMYIDASTITASDYYGESDQKLSNLVDILADLFPDAKFIWLTENNIESIHSIFSDGCFDDVDLGLVDSMQEAGEDMIERDEFSIASDYRVQADKIGVMTTEEWTKMKPFERNCWYWAFWNSMIKEKLNELPSERWLHVKFEDIDSSLNRVVSFLGCREHSFKKTTSHKSRLGKESVQNSGWTEDHKVSYEKWCTPVIEKM